MTSDFYTFEFSAAVVGDVAIAPNQALIFILDTNSKNAASLLEASLDQSYMRHCCLLILQGKNAHHLEELADDHLFEWEDAFVPTATSCDVNETSALINGWEIDKPKKIVIVTDSNTLSDELRNNLLGNS